MRQQTFTRAGSAALLISFFLSALPATHAASGTKAADGTPPASATKKKASKPPKEKSKEVKVTYHKGSGETTAERDRRLKRECKGLPNAGACLGYANQ